MEAYRVGALADLISSKSKDKAKTSKTDLSTLFVSKLPPKPQIAPPTKAAKRPASSDQSVLVKSKKTKTPAKSKESGDRSKKVSTEKPRILQGKQYVDEDLDLQYTKPSLKHMVKLEDQKQRVHNEEEESRTIFVGNLNLKTSDETLRKLFREYGGIETIRFRGAARPDPKTTKKVAVITRKVNEKHQKLFAYIRFKSVEFAEKSCVMNGHELNGNVLRVDMAIPKKEEIDQKKAIFIGNLPFTTEEEDVRNHFQMCGNIVSIRLVRSTTSGMGKGFGYVNFDSTDSVENALQKNGTRMLGRELRVGRAVRKPKPVLQFVQKDKKSVLGKKQLPHAPVIKKVIKVTQKKIREKSAGSSFQGQRSDEPGKTEKIKKKKMNKGAAKKKLIAQKLSTKK